MLLLTNFDFAIEVDASGKPLEITLLHPTHVGVLLFMAPQLVKDMVRIQGSESWIHNDTKPVINCVDLITSP